MVKRKSVPYIFPNGCPLNREGIQGETLRQKYYIFEKVDVISRGKYRNCMSFKSREYIVGTSSKCQAFMFNINEKDWLK